MLIVSALAILLTWGVVAIVLIGIGSLVLRRFTAEFLLTDSFWMALAASVALLEVWSCFSPVNPASGILLCSLGAAGLALNRRILLRQIKFVWKTARSIFVPYLVLVLFLALRASGPCDYYDTGLYGAAAVRWIQTYPVVPGLANLHGRLGFNSSVFLCIASLNQWLWKGLAFHLFTGLLIAAIWSPILRALSRLLRDSSKSPADWFYSIIGIPLAFWTVRGVLVGTLTDEPATILCLAGAGILLEELERKDAEGNSRLVPPRLLVATALFTLALTFKESTIVFAFLAWCLAFRWICFPPTPTVGRGTHIAGAICFSTAIILPWCVRGILLSGYPFFPSSIFGLPVDWRVPPSIVQWYFAGARSWGRMPDVELADTRGYAWLRPWLEHALRDRASFQAPVLICLVGLAAVLGLWFLKKNLSFYPWLWLLLPSLVGAVFWFATSPAFRFGLFAIWTTTGTLGAWAIVSLQSVLPRLARTRMILTGLFALSIWCLISFGWKPPYERLLASPAVMSLPESSLITRQTQSGLTVQVPKEGNQCWDAQLPCTPYFDETLRLRKSSSLRSGFQSDAQEKILPRFQVGQP
jgi:hypothetical protein